MDGEQNTWKRAKCLQRGTYETTHKAVSAIVLQKDPTQAQDWKDGGSDGVATFVSLDCLLYTSDAADE